MPSKRKVGKTGGDLHSNLLKVQKGLHFAGEPFKLIGLPNPADLGDGIGQAIGETIRTGNGRRKKGGMDARRRRGDADLPPEIATEILSYTDPRERYLNILDNLRQHYIQNPPAHERPSALTSEIIADPEAFNTYNDERADHFRDIIFNAVERDAGGQNMPTDIWSEVLDWVSGREDEPEIDGFTTRGYIVTLSTPQLRYILNTLGVNMRDGRPTEKTNTLVSSNASVSAYASDDVGNYMDAEAEMMDDLAGMDVVDDDQNGTPEHQHWNNVFLGNAGMEGNGRRMRGGMDVALTDPHLQPVKFQMEQLRKHSTKKYNGRLVKKTPAELNKPQVNSLILRIKDHLNDALERNEMNEGYTAERIQQLIHDPSEPITPFGVEQAILDDLAGMQGYGRRMRGGDINLPNPEGEPESRREPTPRPIRIQQYDNQIANHTGLLNTAIRDIEGGIDWREELLNRLNDPQQDPLQANLIRDDLLVLQNAIRNQQHLIDDRRNMIDRLRERRNELQREENMENNFRQVGRGRRKKGGAFTTEQFANMGHALNTMGALYQIDQKNKSKSLTGFGQYAIPSSQYQPRRFL
jgi:hypothetical protein